MAKSEDLLTWDELLKRWGMEPSHLVFLLCRLDGPPLRPAGWDRSLDYPGVRPKKVGFPGWDNAFDDVRFSLSDIEAYEEKLPELAPSRRSLSKPKSKKQKKQFPDSQRHYWRCRAVARVLWEENRSLTPSQVAASLGVAKFGCQDRIDGYELNVVEEWVADVCRDSYKVEDDDDLPKIDRPLFETKPKMRPNQRHRERARAVAGLLWSKDPSMTIADLIHRDEINGIACCRRNYDETVLRRWVKDLRPQDQPAGRPKRNQRSR